MSNEDRQEPFKDSFDGDTDPTAQTSPRQSSSDGSSRQNQSDFRATDQQEASSVSPESPVEQDEEPTVNNQGCVIIGPSGAGKTTLLAAIHRSCQMIDDDGVEFKFISSDGRTADLIKLGINYILNDKKGFDATTTVERYPFYIKVAEKRKNFWSLPPPIGLHIEMTDGGGGFIFLPDSPTDNLRREMTRKIRSASILVLCVDASNPKLDMLSKELEGLITDVHRKIRISPETTFVQRLLNRINDVRFPLPPAQIEPCLNVDRLLILLTQVDKLTNSHRNPLDIAKRIEPVALAVDLLTPELLGSLLKALKPGAQLAVGTCSAFGFIPQTGGTFADAVGKPNIVRKGSGEIALRNWTPFGIREAIYFIATGKSRLSVKRIMEDDLKPRRYKRMVRVDERNLPDGEENYGNS